MMMVVIVMVMGVGNAHGVELLVGVGVRMVVGMLVDVLVGMGGAVGVGMRMGVLVAVLMGMGAAGDVVVIKMHKESSFAIFSLL